MHFLLHAALLAFVLGGCNTTEKDTGPGTDDTDDTVDTDDTGEPAVFDPENPGISMTLSLGAVEMMGQFIEMGVGVFMVAAREEFDPDDEVEVPLDSCVIVVEEVPVPECTGEEDCAPEQDCVPDYDDSGNPITGTEHCETPREPIDVGPLTLEGCAGCPVELAYNSGQSGAYTTAGGDGSLPSGTLGSDLTVTCSGAGNEALGLGAFSGEVYLGPALELTSPPEQPSDLGPYIDVDADADLPLAWSSGDPGGSLTFNLAGVSLTGKSGAILCRVTDDGAFTIPADMVVAAQLGDIAFLNMLTIERPTEGSASGKGLTRHDVQGVQTRLLNMQKL